MADWCSALLLLIVGSRIGGAFGQLGQTSASNPTSGLCEANSVSLVGVSPQLIQVQVVGQETSFIIDLRGYQLPRQCEMDPRRCHTFLVGGEGEQWRYLAISVVGAVLVVDLEGSSSQTPIVVSIRRRRSQCDPVDLVFLRDADDFLYMSAACEGTSSLEYLSFFLDLSSTSPEFISEGPPLQSSTGFSQTVLVPNILCSNSLESTFYVVTGEIVWSYPATGLVNRVFKAGSHLQNCSSVAYVDFPGTSGSFIIHCTNDVAINYSTCSEQPEYHYLSEGGIPFPSPFLTAMYRRDSIVVTHSSNGSIIGSLNHSIGTIIRGRCFGTFFVAVASNGSLSVVNLVTGVVFAAIAQVCNESCVLPAFGSRGFTVYDFLNSSLIRASFVEGCDHPVVESPATGSDFLLPLFISAAATGQRTCECPVVNSPPPATREMPDVIPPNNSTPGDESTVVPPAASTPPDETMTPPVDSRVPPDSVTTTTTSTEEGPSTSPDDVAGRATPTTPPDESTMAPPDSVTTTITTSTEEGPSTSPSPDNPLDGRATSTTPPDTSTTLAETTTPPNDNMTTQAGTTTNSTATLRIMGEGFEEKLLFSLPPVIGILTVLLVVVIMIVIVLCCLLRWKKNRALQAERVGQGMVNLVGSSRDDEKSDSAVVNLECNGDAKEHVTSNLSTPSPVTTTESPGSDDGLLNDGGSPPKQDVLPYLFTTSLELPGSDGQRTQHDGSTPPASSQGEDQSVPHEKSSGMPSQPKEVSKALTPLEAISDRPCKTVAQPTPPPHSSTQTQEGSGVGTSQQAMSDVNIVSQPVSQLSTPSQEKLLLHSYEGSFMLQETSELLHATASPLPAVTPHAQTSSLVVSGVLTPRAPNGLQTQPYDPRPFQAASHPNGFAEQDRYSEQWKRECHSSTSSCSETASPFCTKPEESHSNGDGGGLVTGRQGIPSNLITSNSISEAQANSTSNDDKRNAKLAKVQDQLNRDGNNQ